MYIYSAVNPSNRNQMKMYVSLYMMNRYDTGIETAAGRADWESDWVPLLECAGGSTVECHFVSSQPANYPASGSIPAAIGEICNWEGSTITITNRSYNRYDLEGCVNPTPECGSWCKAPENATLEVEWVPGSDWADVDSCSQGNFLAMEGVHSLCYQNGCKLYGEGVDFICRGFYGGCDVSWTAVPWVSIDANYSVCDAVVNAGLGLSSYIPPRTYGGAYRLCRTSDEGFFEKTASTTVSGVSGGDCVDLSAMSGTTLVMDFSGTHPWTNLPFDPGHYNLTFNCS